MKRAADKSIRPFVALRIVAVYVVVAILWIVFSDWALFWLFDDPRLQVLLQIYKGVFFVAVTGLLLWALIQSAIVRIRRTHTELDKNRVLLEGVIEGTSDIVFAKDRQGRYILINKTGCDFVGKPADEIIGRDDYAILPADEAERIRDDDRRTLEAGGTIRIEETITEASDQKRVLESTKGPLRNQSGEIFGTFGITRDITFQKEIEKDIERQTRLLEATFASIDEVILVIDAETRTIVIANEAAEKIFGYTPGEMIGHSTEFLHRSKKAYEDFARLGEPVLQQDQSFHIDWTMARKDGVTFPAEITVSAIRPELGWGSGVVSVIRDVTEQQRAQQELRRLNKTLRMISLCNEALVRARNEEELVETILKHLAGAGDYPVGWIGLNTEDDQPMDTTFCCDEIADFFRRLESQQCRTLACFKTACSENAPRPIHLDPSRGCCQCRHCRQMYADYSLRSAYCLPLVSKDNHIGCLMLFSTSESFYAEEISLLEELADDVAYGIQALRTEEAHSQMRKILRVRNRAIEASVNGIMISENRLPEIPLIYVNPAFETITGYSSEEVLGRSAQLLVAGDYEQKGLADIRAALKKGRAETALLRSYRRDGSLFWNELSISPVQGEEGRITHFVGIIHDVTERKRYEDELARKSNYDDLTGLANRNLLYDRLQQAVVQSERAGESLAVFLIDLDRFQIINDSLGHSLGNELLKQVGRRLRDCMRREDTLARLSADEFVLVRQGHNERDRVKQVVGQIQQALSEHFLIGERQVEISASIGVSLFPDDAENPDTLLRNADLAMYEAKDMGRDTFSLFTREMNLRVVETLDLESDLRRALEREEFLLHFQPKVEVATGRIVGSEALLRWQHPERGMVSPGAFIPLAEETGLIDRLGLWALREACRQNRALHEQGLAAHSVAVNVSARQFRNPDFSASVAAVLEETGLDPRLLEIELTESMVMDRPEEAIEILNELKRRGIGVSLDDFGTGYSSLNYLRRLPVDNLKIDRSFINDITESAGAASVADSIIDIAHNLDILAIAEGVENPNQLEMLKDYGCDLYQGFYFSRPVPADRFAELLRNSS